MVVVLPDGSVHVGAALHLLYGRDAILPQEGVGEYLADDGEQANRAVLLDFGFITCLGEYDNICVLQRARDKVFG